MRTRNDDEQLPPHHARSRRSLSVVRGIALALVAVVASVGGLAYGLVNHLQGNIDTYDTSFLTQADTTGKDAASKDPKDTSAGKSVNILIMGTDWRGGDNSAVADDGVGGQRSDTTMVAHISADRKRVDIVSIPRDSLVDVPACTLDAQGKLTTGAAPGTMFNAAFGFGWDKAQAAGWSTSKSFGAAATCTWETVQAITGITLSGYVIFDFTGFESMINALGGVDVCVPNEITAPKAGNLHLDAGWNTLSGKVAIKYARAREGVGDGTDLARIGRQQGLVGSVANKFLSENYVTDSPKLIRFIDAATKSIHTSSNIGSGTSMAGLLFSLRNLSTSDITFETVPWHYDLVDKSRVDWTEPDATTLWQKVDADEPITPPKKKAAAKPTTTSTTKPTTAGTSTATTAPKAKATPKVATGGETGQLSASSLPTTKSQCDALIRSEG